jgi:hypothetical protein
MPNLKREVIVVRYPYPTTTKAVFKVLGYIVLFYTVIVGACALATAIK